MATIKNAYGFRSARPANGGSSGRTRQYSVANSYGTALGNGDPVALSAGSLVRATAAKPVIGIVQEFNYIDTNGKPRFANNLPVSTSSTGLMFGALTPTAIIEGAAGNTFNIFSDASISTDAMGKYADVSFGAVDINGNSGCVIKASTVTTVAVSGSTYPAMVKLLNFVNEVDNSPTDAYPLIEVEFIHTLI